VRTKITVFWDVTPCSLVHVGRRFGETCRLYPPRTADSYQPVVLTPQPNYVFLYRRGDFAYRRMWDLTARPGICSRSATTQIHGAHLIPNYGDDRTGEVYNETAGRQNDLPWWKPKIRRYFHTHNPPPPLSRYPTLNQFNPVRLFTTISVKFHFDNFLPPTPYISTKTTWPPQFSDQNVQLEKWC
jgi:hypothetical protein